MNPRLFLWSKLGTFLLSERTQELVRSRARLARRLTGGRRVVHYFHEVDDPYSHLAVQKLEALRAAYSLPFDVHLVSKPADEFLGSSAHFSDWGMRDAAAVAESYGVRFPNDARPPDPASVTAANGILAEHLGSPSFAEVAERVGEALWTGGDLGEGDTAAGERAVAAGNALRASLYHYSGGMFYFEGEWYWGVDRLRLLEERLIDEGLAEAPGQVLVPEPTPADATGLDASDVVLEYFFSLRSPYTFVRHPDVLDLVQRSGVTLRLRPVLPMVMRGVPAPLAKRVWIIADAAREGRARGNPFGRFVDPVGNPVRRAFALYPGAVALGRELEYVTEFLKAAWADGVDISGEAGLRQVVERSGMGWDELHDAARGTDVQTMLDENLEVMLRESLWGVPSFRVTGGRVDGEERAFACWGQDRLWRVEDEIVRRAAR